MIDAENLDQEPAVRAPDKPEDATDNRWVTAHGKWSGRVFRTDLRRLMLLQQTTNSF
jgi:hypothetical protein